MTNKSGDILVAGGGKVGDRAVETLGGRVGAVIDLDPDPKLARHGADLVVGAAEKMLDQVLAQGEFKWLVPAAPGHLVAEWLSETAGGEAVDFPGQYLPTLPFALAAGKGRFYLSLADFACPPGCPEPADKCTHTGQPRGEDLFRRLAGIEAPGWRVASLRSRQLAPGLGGVLVADIIELRRQVAEIAGPWLVCLSCRCHGAVQALSF